MPNKLTRTQERILEIVNAAKECGSDQVIEVKDYFASQDSHFSRQQIIRMIDNAKDALAADIADRLDMPMNSAAQPMTNKDETAFQRDQWLQARADQHDDMVDYYRCSGID